MSDTFEVSRKVKIAEQRVIKQLSDSAIKKDAIRAMVELITNADDSYKKIEINGRITSGSIKIEIVRKRKNSIFRIIDNAEGFDAEKMDERIGGFGYDTSGLTKGYDVRGYFGRGLKEAIIGLGKGSVISVNNNHIYECFLDETAEYKRKAAVKINKSIRKKLINEFGIYNDGTVILITVIKNDVNIPQIDNFIFQLERYFSLREINSSKKRNVFVIEKTNNGKIKKTQKLEYNFPLGKEVVNEQSIFIKEYQSAKIDLRLFIANDPLSQDGPCREGGVLIKSKTAIHDITLFSFDGNPYADKICGYLKCEYIDDLLINDEPILSDRRDGLDWNYPFCKALKKIADKELKKIVDKIKEEEGSRKKKIENEKTRQRFLSALEKLNKIALDELSAEGIGRTEKKTGKSITPPPSGFDFVPEYYHIIAGNNASLSLKATVPYIIPDGSIVNIESDNDDVIIESLTFEINEKEANDGIVVINPKVRGKRVGAEAIVTAKINGYNADAFVKVVAKIDKLKKHKKRKGKDKGGLFNDIIFDPFLGPQTRHYFDRETSIIKISIKHPSIESYLGPNCEGQDLLHCQVLIAELVTDAVCREIARRKAETGRLSILGEYMDAVYREHNNLINKYAHIIHQYLVSSEARR